MTFSSLLYLLKEGFRNIWSNRTMSLASVGVLVSCLLLTGAAVLFSINVGQAMQVMEDQNSISVYLNDDVGTAEAAMIGREIAQLPNVQDTVFVSKNEAMQEYLDALGEDGQVLEDLLGDDNPLPHAYRVSLRDVSLYQETADQISQIDGVYRINDYTEVASMLTRIDFLVRIVGIVIVVFLAVVSLFIISNTIRVTMFSRRLEISIMKSVGATNGFIRIPFLVEGMILGLISGALGSGLLLIIYSQVAGAVSGIIAAFQPIPTSSIAWWIVLTFLAAGVLFGTVGGLISISKFLKKERGEINVCK